jgi:signal transduction histidine kinase
MGAIGRSPSEDSPTKSKAFVILVAILVAFAGLAFDRLLLHEGVPRYDLLAISNLLTGIVAGGFFWQAMHREREHREFVQERLRTISDMNHHIRNALQVISLHSYRDQDEKTLEILQQAVSRIEWALNEILPGQSVRNLVPDLSRKQSTSERTPG